MMGNQPRVMMTRRRKKQIPFQTISISSRITLMSTTWLRRQTRPPVDHYRQTGLRNNCLAALPSNRKSPPLQPRQNKRYRITPMRTRPMNEPTSVQINPRQRQVPAW